MSTRQTLIEQLVSAFHENRDEINSQGCGVLPDDLEQYAADLLDWNNLDEEGYDAEALKLAYMIGAALQVRGFDCAHCGARCFQGRPDNTDVGLSWEDFQGANENECSCVCDSCHMHSAEAREIEQEGRC